MKATCGTYVTVKGVKGKVFVVGVVPNGIVGRVGKKIVAAGKDIIAKASDEEVGNLKEADAASKALARQLANKNINLQDALRSPHATIAQLTEWLLAEGNEYKSMFTPNLRERFTALQENPLLPMIGLELGDEIFLQAYFLSAARIAEWDLLKAFDGTAQNAMAVLLDFIAPYWAKAMESDLIGEGDKAEFDDAYHEMQEWAADPTAFLRANKKPQYTVSDYNQWWVAENALQAKQRWQAPAHDAQVDNTLSTLRALHRTRYWWDAVRTFPRDRADICDTYVMDAFVGCADMAAIHSVGVTVLWVWHRERAKALEELRRRVKGEVVGAQEEDVDPRAVAKFREGHDYRVEAKLHEVARRCASTPLRVAIVAITSGLMRAGEDEGPVGAALFALDQIVETYDVSNEFYDLDAGNLFSAMQRLDGLFLVSDAEPVDARRHALQTGAEWGAAEQAILRDVFGMSLRLGKDPTKSVASTHVDEILRQLRSSLPPKQAQALAKQMAALMMQPAYRQMPDWLTLAVVDGEASFLLSPYVVSLIAAGLMGGRTVAKAISLPLRTIGETAAALGVWRVSFARNEMDAAYGLGVKEDYQRAFRVLLEGLQQYGLEIREDGQVQAVAR